MVMYDYYDTAEQAAAYARNALALMDERKILLNPRNFTIWYSYTCGNPPDLVKAIDAACAGGKPFTEEVSRQLWESYLDTPARATVVGDASDKLERQISDVMRILDVAGTDTRGYGKALRESVEQLARSNALGSVKDVITSLVTETQTMADRTRALELQLQASAREAAELRVSLEATTRDALTDALTGIANRKHFDQKLRAETAAAAGGEPLCLLMADIDFFKRFNDTHGHPIGDQVLKLVARTLTETLKGRDTPARFGGEEFAVLLPQTALESAVIVAEQIRVRVASRVVKRRDTQQQLGAITLSIGVTQYRPGDSMADLVQRADEALYAAKGAGRNRVHVQVPLSTIPVSPSVATPSAVMQ